MIQTSRSAAPSAESDFSPAEVQEIVRISEAQGWAQAAHDCMRQRNHRAYRLAVDEYGAHLRFLLPVGPASRVLQVGCNWGALAINLAQCTAATIAMDDRPSRLRFVAARQRAAGLAGLHLVCGGPSPKLPFANGVFDAVILSGSRGVARLPEARRVLRPGGWLLLAVANGLGGWISRVGRVRQSVGAPWACDAELRQLGFRDLRVYASLPSLEQPFIILPLDRPKLVEYCLDRLFAASGSRAKLQAWGLGVAFDVARLLWRMTRGLGVTRVARYLVPDYCVVARA